MLVDLDGKVWRTLRRLYLLGGEAEWSEVRDWNRRGLPGGKHYTWLVTHGLIEAVPGSDTRVRLTDLGRTVQELGEMDLPVEALT